jgi:hypothetical protein
MRREPGRRRRDRPGAGRPRAGLAHAALRAAARLVTTGFTITGFAVTGLLAGCGSPAPGTFHPSGRTASAAGAGHAGPSRNGLAWPPFGANVHIVMPGWRPADASEIPAVIAAQDFLLAFLYAEYRGNQDDRWTSYASGRVMSALRSNLQAPDVTTESFAGTIIFSHMTAFADPTIKGAIDVSECFSNARSANISLATGKVIPDQAPANQHYYRNTDVMAQSHGRWQVVSVYPVVYYPQAKECKP